jgi:Ribbon-helix-helix protein, copG family
MSRKRGSMVYLSEQDKEKLEKIAQNWGVSQSSAIQRLIKEYKIE